MNIKAVQDAVASLGVAIETTINPGERDELDSIRRRLILWLNKHGVFIGTNPVKPMQN